MPPPEVEEKIARYARDGRPTHRPNYGRERYTIVETLWKQNTEDSALYALPRTASGLTDCDGHGDIAPQDPRAQDTRAASRRWYGNTKPRLIHSRQDDQGIEVKVERPAEPLMPIRRTPTEPDPFWQLVDLPRDGDRRRPPTHRNGFSPESSRWCDSADRGHCPGDITSEKLAEINVKESKGESGWEGS